MPYIDKDLAIKTAIESCVKVVGHGITQVDAVDIADAFENIPTADVVPKSDYDILKSLITHKEEEAYNKGYEDGKADIVREIFEEIERLHLHITNGFDLRRYNELKKKFTENIK